MSGLPGAAGSTAAEGAEQNPVGARGPCGNPGRKNRRRDKGALQRGRDRIAHLRGAAAQLAGGERPDLRKLEKK